MVARPSAAMVRRAAINRSVSGEGESLKADIIHRPLGMTTSRARIPAAMSQFRTIKMRSATWAIGSAADDEGGLDMIRPPPGIISNINKLFIECRQDDYWKSIKRPHTSPGV